MLVMDIVFVTDFVCPYCLVAKEALAQALKETGLEARIRLCPMELTEEPARQVDTYHDEKRRAGYQVLEEPARQLGLDMKLPPAVVPRPYTRLAFEGWHMAEENGLGEVYSDLIYKAYFIDEKDIGDMDVLTGSAKKAGLDKEAFRRALITGRYSEKEKEACAYARRVLQVKSIPAIYLNGRKVELSAFTKEEMCRILLQEKERADREGAGEEDGQGASGGGSGR